MSSERVKIFNGALLRGYRMALHISRREVGEMLGVPAYRISWSERGLEEDLRLYLRIAEEIGLSSKNVMITE